MFPKLLLGWLPPSLRLLSVPSFFCLFMKKKQCMQARDKRAGNKDLKKQRHEEASAGFTIYRPNYEKGENDQKAPHHQQTQLCTLFIFHTNPR